MVIDFYFLKNKEQSQMYFDKENLNSKTLNKCQEIGEYLLAKCKGQKLYKVEIDDNLDNYKVLSVDFTTYFWDVARKEHLDKYKKDNEEAFRKGEFILQASCTGIKCDNEDCSWTDWSVTEDEYPNYIDKPCPCCGENLLTKECYEKTQMVMKQYRAFSNMFSKLKIQTFKEDYAVSHASISKNGDLYDIDIEQYDRD